MSPMPIGKITPSENADVLTRKPNNKANKIQTAYFERNMVILFRMCLSERRIVIDTNALKVIDCN